MTLTTQPAESSEFDENIDSEQEAEEAKDQVEATTEDQAVSIEAPAENVEATVEDAPDSVEETVDEGLAEPGAESAQPESAVTEEPSHSDEAASTLDEAPAQSDEEAAEPIDEPKPPSPYDLPGDWYVIHSYSGYENKVKANLESRIKSMHMEDRIFDVHIPMEDVVEFKGGKKVTTPKKVFPGYILVRMGLDDDSWYAVRNTPGVTGFVAGNAQKPTPLSRREVERFLGVREEEEKGKPRFKPEWEVAEQVRVVTGPFADFNGTIEEINIDQQKVVVLVNIFGRDTPVELGFEDIQKN
jgi:transcriptional antiterminator NusG